ncbi:MAG: YfiR family protein [Bacteroidales bacterium]|nr:YfiR family protein [Bacteroidales bacterium]MBN2820343.1 YfiR family protein [Bacteroidales bacterium]
MGQKSIKILIAMLFAFQVSVHAQTNVDKAQALFIYNFLSHTMWPENFPMDNIKIGIYGTTNTSNTLQEFTKERKVGTKGIMVFPVNSLEELSNCNVLLVAYNSSNKLPDIMSKVKNKPCLVITEKSGCIASGAAIEFEIVNDKLKFRANLDNAKNQKLMLSSALLNMSL